MNSDIEECIIGFVIVLMLVTTWVVVQVSTMLIRAVFWLIYKVVGRKYDSRDIRVKRDN
jgi:hypothetical protein